MKFKAICLLMLMFLLSLSAVSPALAQLRVVTTTTDLASLVEFIGGEKVEVTSITRPLQDAHYLDATPGMVVRVGRADMFVENGMELEAGWVPEVMRQTRNRTVRPGGNGYVDASKGITPIQVPERIHRDMGDVHPSGNPHYTLEPVTSIAAAGNIADGLIRIDSENTDYYLDNLARYEEKSRGLIEEWKEKFAPHEGAGVIVYHKHFDYMLEALGLEVVDAIEPLPGLAPTARHVAGLLSDYSSDVVKVVIMEPWHDDRLPERVAEGIGVELVKPAPAVGAYDDTADIFSLFESNARMILEAIE